MIQSIILNRTALAEELIAKGADIRTIAVNQALLFELALHYGRIDYLDMLLDKFAQTKEIHGRQSAVLSLLVSMDSDDPQLIDRIGVLLDQGANINAQTHGGETAVMLAG